MNTKYINVYGSFKLLLIVFLQILIQKLNNIIQVRETTIKRYCYFKNVRVVFITFILLQKYLYIHYYECGIMKFHQGNTIRNLG